MLAGIVNSSCGRLATFSVRWTPTLAGIASNSCIRPATFSILAVGIRSRGDSGGVIAAVPMVVNGNGSGIAAYAPWTLPAP